jgi:hypothetical protein
MYDVIYIHIYEIGKEKRRERERENEHNCIRRGTMERWKREREC